MNDHGRLTGPLRWRSPPPGAGRLVFARSPTSSSGLGQAGVNPALIRCPGTRRAVEFSQPLGDQGEASMQMARASLIIVICGLPFATAYAQPSPCEVDHQAFVEGGTATATMVLQQGEACEFKFRFGKEYAPDRWELVESPKSGKVAFKDDVAQYQPTGSFSGQDKFVVAVFGNKPNCSHRCARNGRFEVAVTVTPKP